MSLSAIVGIDPGTQTLGLSTIWFNPQTMVIDHIDVETVIGSHHHYKEWVGDYHGERFNKLMGHTDYLSGHFERCLPIAIACESPFYSRLHPGAFEALLGTVQAIRQSVMNYSMWKPLDTVDPPTVKKAIGAAYNAKKDEVFKAFQISELYKLVTNPQDLSEHAVDATAVAYWRYKLFL
mgnify:CR=1 FL=1